MLAESRSGRAFTIMIFGGKSIRKDVLARVKQVFEWCVTMIDVVLAVAYLVDEVALVSQGLVRSRGDGSTS